MPRFRFEPALMAAAKRLAPAALVFAFTAVPAAGAVATATPVLSPNPATIVAGKSQTFVATSTHGVTWSVDGVANGNTTVGRIVGAGDVITYVAPSTSGSHVLKATSTWNKAYSGTAKITVVQSVSVAMSPSALSTSPGATSTLTATVSGATSKGVTWTVDGVTGGSKATGLLSGTGTTVTFTAPASAGSHVIKAVAAVDTSKSATCSVTILAPAVTVAVTPGSGRLQPGGTLPLAATVSGATNTAVTWSVDGIAGGNTTVGTLSGSGNSVTYVAPSVVGTHTVTATSQAKSTSSASSSISVTSVAVTLAGSRTTTLGGSALLVANVTGTANTGVAWSVDGVPGGNATTGTLKVAGRRALYVAPATCGTHTIVAKSLDDSSRSAALAVTVSAVDYTITNPTKIFNVKTGFGALGDGVSDDTPEISRALDAASSAGGGVVLFPAGTYMIDCTYHTEYGLMPGSNTTLQFEPGAILQTLPTPSSLSAYYLIYLSGVSNVNLVGPGCLVGDRATRTSPSEYGMGIGLGEGSKNIVIAGLTIKGCCGDGIYVGAGTRSCSNVLVYGVTSTGNRRQGMTINCVNGMVVRDSTFSNTSGTNPQCGIDIEPESGQNVNAVQIHNCAFLGNTGGGIQCGPGDANRTTATFTGSTIAFNSFSGNANWGIRIQDCTGNALVGNALSGVLRGALASGFGFQIRNYALNLVVEQNSITSCSSDGMNLSDCQGTWVSTNTVTNNAGAGIRNTSSGVTLLNNLVSGNTLGN